MAAVIAVSMMQDPNPYSSSSSDSTTLYPVFEPPIHTASITWITLLVSFTALLANYGYSAFMNPFWYFYILPALSAVTTLASTVALGRRHVESGGFSFLPLISVFAVIATYAIALAILTSISPLYLMNLLPRLAAVAAAIAIAAVATIKLHGSTRGRRGLILATGTSTLQATTSIADTVALGFGPWPA